MEKRTDKSKTDLGEEKKYVEGNSFKLLQSGKVITLQ
jgi:hypothetical protein